MRNLTLLIFLLAISLSGMAYDFVLPNGQAYTITDAKNREVQLEYNPSSPYTGHFRIPDTVNYAGQEYKVTGTGFMCFYASAITGVEFGSYQTRIGDNSFYGCAALTQVSIPDRITYLGGSAFMYCTALETVALGRGISSIPEYAFNTCTQLRSLIIPDQVTDIAYASLAYCEHLDSVVVGSRVESIGKQAFFKSQVSRLIVRPEIPPTVVSDAFPETILQSTQLFVPLQSVGAYQSAEVWKGFSNLSGIYMQPADTVLTPVDTIPTDTLTADSCVLKYQVISPEERTCAVVSSVPHPSSLTPGVYVGDVVIPETVELTYGGETATYTVTQIAAHAFERCYDLHSIVMPNSITEIGDSAFYGCYRSDSVGLTHIRMSDGLRRSGEYAFFGCGALKDVEIGDLTNWATIDFVGARSNPLPWAKHLLVNGEEPSTLKIPGTVETISPYAFYNILGRTRIEFSEGVRSIGTSAFCFGEDISEVVLGPDVEWLAYASFLKCPAITDIYCQGICPPGALQDYDYEFDYEVTQNATLHIPYGTRDAYAEANLWQCFVNIVEDQFNPELEGLVTPQMQPSGAESQSARSMYDLQGRRLSPNSYKGLYITGRQLRLK